jgi:hypothetical protein
MFIEMKDPGRIRDEIAKFLGVNTGEATYLQIGDERLPGIFEAGQSDDRRISAVQYVRFRFNAAQIEDFIKGDKKVSLVIDHSNYQYTAAIDGELRRELTADLTAH